MRGQLSRRAFLGGAGAAALVTLPRPSRATAREGAPERLSVDVAVVGAGLAGLVAARELTRRGVSVAVLEAASGGWSLPEATTGALEDHERLIGIARRHRAVGALPSGGEVLEGDSDGARPVADGAWSADGRVASEIASALTKLDRMAGEVDVAAPWAAVNAPVRDAHTLGSWLDGSVAGEAARRRLVTGFELALGASPSEVSLLFALLTIAGAGGANRLLAADYRPTHEVSTAALLGALSPSSVRPGAHTVTVEGDGAVVTAADASVDAGHVVVADARGVTVPGGNTRRFTQDSVAVARCTYPGVLGLGSRSAHVLGDGAPVHVVRPGADGISLVAVIAGSAAREWMRRDDDARREAVLESLVRWLGPRVAEPVRYAESTGSSEPRVVAPPGALTSLGPGLRAPEGPVSWAGPETATEWIGHPEGLIVAGERAAADVAAAVEA